MIKLKCGYNCINMSLGRTFRTFKLSTLINRDIEKIVSIIDHNLMLLGDIIYFNINNNIKLFRISAELIPFFSHPLMLELLQKESILERKCVINEIDWIKSMTAEQGIVLSIHPGQYNVLNSFDSMTVKRSLVELKVQSDFLELLGGNRIILHLGGVYGNKDLSKQRFISRCKNHLNPSILNKLKLENDDKSYNCNDVIDVCKELDVGWVYDFHHERLNPSRDIDNLLRFNHPDKYHICDGRDIATGGFIIRHDDYITKSTMRSFINQLERCDIKEADIMFESRMKDWSLFEIMTHTKDGYWTLKD